jgi:hypothetical protein
MNQARWLLTLAAILTGVQSVAATVQPAPGIAERAYRPLLNYQGKWNMVETGARKIDRLENRCARTGLFFACEQVVNGKPLALIVFLPIAQPADAATGVPQYYRNQALLADASPGGEWGKLAIQGDQWTYTWENKAGGNTTYWKNINTFYGADRITFEVSNSTDGKTWKLRKSGEERRAK